MGESRRFCQRSAAYHISPSNGSFSRFSSLIKTSRLSWAWSFTRFSVSRKTWPFERSSQTKKTPSLLRYTDRRCRDHHKDAFTGKLVPFCVSPLDTLGDLVKLFDNAQVRYVFPIETYYELKLYSNPWSILTKNFTVSTCLHCIAEYLKNVKFIKSIATTNS